MIILGRQQEKRTSDLAEVGPPAVDAELAENKLVGLIKVLDESAEGLPCDRDIVVDPPFHREVIRDHLGIIDLLVERDVLFNEILNWLHIQEAGLQEPCRTVAIGVDQGVDIEILLLRPTTQKRLSTAEVDGGCQQGESLDLLGMERGNKADIVPP